MRARQLIDSASFGPDALGAAFDAGWTEIACHLENDPNDIAVFKNGVLEIAIQKVQLCAGNGRQVSIRTD
jgi:hypothetical protein